MTADINADRKERRRLQSVRHAAREVAANIVYQSIVRDSVKEAYLENLNKYEDRADSAPIWFCGLLGRECCDVFRRLSDMHVALLRDVIKNGGGAEYISEALEDVFRDPAYKKVCPVHRRLSFELLKTVYEQCISTDWPGQLLAAASELLLSAAPEDEIFAPAVSVLNKASDRNACSAEIMGYASVLAKGGMDIRGEVEAFAQDFSGRYSPGRVQPCLRAYVFVAAWEGTLGGVDFAVAVNEALDLIKKYCGSDATGYVNALLQEYHDFKEKGK